MDALREIQTDLLHYIREQTDAGDQLDTTTNLVGSGLLDSLLVTDLVLHLQAVHCAQLDGDDVTPENFRDIASLSQLIAAKMLGRKAGRTPCRPEQAAVETAAVCR
jgi:acyl carrier protein